jgi:hypothetical protein
VRLMHPVPVPCWPSYLKQCECVVLEQPFVHCTVSCQLSYQNNCAQCTQCQCPSGRLTFCSVNASSLSSPLYIIQCHASKTNKLLAPDAPSANSLLPALPFAV